MVSCFEINEIAFKLYFILIFNEIFKFLGKKDKSKSLANLSVSAYF